MPSSFGCSWVGRIGSGIFFFSFFSCFFGAVLRLFSRSLLCLVVTGSTGTIDAEAGDFTLPAAPMASRVALDLSKWKMLRKILSQNLSWRLWYRYYYDPSCHSSTSSSSKSQGSSPQRVTALGDQLESHRQLRHCCRQWRWESCQPLQCHCWVRWNSW